MSAPARGDILYRAAGILEGNFERISAEMTREEGKTLPKPGRGAPVDQHFSLLRGRGIAAAGDAGSLRARSRPHVRAAQAGGGGGAHHAMEFSQRDSGVEAGAGPDLRQHGGAENRRRRLR